MPHRNHCGLVLLRTFSQLKIEWHHHVFLPWEQRISSDIRSSCRIMIKLHLLIVEWTMTIVYIGRDCSLHRQTLCPIKVEDSLCRECQICAIFIKIAQKLFEQPITSKRSVSGVSSNKNQWHRMSSGATGCHRVPSGCARWFVIWYSRNHTEIVVVRF